jgi:hypothetical protein
VTTYRIEKTKNYCTISNAPLNDLDLTWEAKGMLAYLLSRPDDWVINVNQLWAASSNGHGAVKRILRELETFGYISRRKYRNDKGLFEWEKVISESRGPIAPHAPKDVRKPPQRKTADPTIGRKPSDGIPSDGIPSDGNPFDGFSSDILSTELLSTELLSTEEQTTTTTTSSSSSNQQPAAAQSQGEDTPAITATPQEAAAVAAALVDHGLAADEQQAQINAAALLAEHPPDSVIRAAVATAAQDGIENPYGYMLGILKKWRKQGGPPPPGPGRKRGGAAQQAGEPQTEDDRRRKYDPAYWAGANT